MSKVQKPLLEYTSKSGIIYRKVTPPMRGLSHNKVAWVANQAVAITDQKRSVILTLLVGDSKG
jgi:hypothetical protein